VNVVREVGLWSPTHLKYHPVRPQTLSLQRTRREPAFQLPGSIRTPILHFKLNVICINGEFLSRLNMLLYLVMVSTSHLPALKNPYICQQDPTFQIHRNNSPTHPKYLGTRVIDKSETESENSDSSQDALNDDIGFEWSAPQSQIKVRNPKSNDPFLSDYNESVRPAVAKFLSK
jgi:hypothetical protein